MIRNMWKHLKNDFCFQHFEPLFWFDWLTDLTWTLAWEGIHSCHFARILPGCTYWTDLPGASYNQRPATEVFSHVKIIEIDFSQSSLFLFIQMIFHVTSWKLRATMWHPAAHIGNGSANKRMKSAFAKKIEEFSAFLVRAKMTWSFISICVSG